MESRKPARGGVWVGGSPAPINRITGEKAKGTMIKNGKGGTMLEKPKQEKKQRV